MAQNEADSVSWGQVGRKIFRTLCSMQLSLVLLGIILIACVAGSIVPQGASESALNHAFGEGPTRLILLLHLEQVFTCWWFVALAALLCLNLVLCSTMRFPQVLRRWRQSFSLQKRLDSQNASFELELDGADAASVLARAGFRPNQSADGMTYAVKNKLGVWGSWLCHFGMLLVIVGFAAGRMLSTEYVVYGIPGSTQPIGDSGYTLTIDDFSIGLREDYTVEQYTAALTVTAADGTTHSGEASVNHPFSAFGLELFQDSTGWANYVDITLNGELIKQDLICAGEYTYPDTLPNLVLLLNAFYPDLVRTSEGGLYTATPLLNNPYSLYSLYYQDKMVGMNVVEMGVPVQVENYAFTLYDPVQYTLIVIRHDPTAWLVGVSAVVMLLGIFLAFYCRPQEVWTDGKTLWARAQKAPGLLQTELASAIRAASPKTETED
ncbi:MAG: cytochrome c biogenesis protein ResB [Ruminococcus flavefaciens]|nr:cytochrome c biogenesis protein ResB [Ruminococcus flavefaciens]